MIIIQKKTYFLATAAIFLEANYHVYWPVVNVQRSHKEKYTFNTSNREPKTAAEHFHFTKWLHKHADVYLLMLWFTHN